MRDGAGAGSTAATLRQASHDSAAVPRGWSLGAKLSAVALLFAATIGVLAAVSTLALRIVDGTRAYVGGEGLWSKGQKDAVYYLSRYTRRLDPEDLHRYQQAVAIPLGDRTARLELDKADYDPAVARRGFEQGLNAPEDVPALIFLYRHFRFLDRMDEAVRIWAEADTHIAKLVACAEEIEAAIRTQALTPERRSELLDRIAAINDRLTPLEQRFSAVLGETARWVRTVALSVIAALAVVLLGVGLLVAGRLARDLRQDIRALQAGALQVAAGDLTHPLRVRSGDEVGELTQAFNRMVAQRREAEEALRSSNALAGSVIGTAYDAYVAMDARGCVLDWNAQAERTFGWTRAEAVGRPLAELIIPERFRALHREGLARYLKTGEHRVLNQRIEISALHRSGREFPVELTIWALGEGQTQRFNAFLHDITERQRGVQRLAAQKTAAAALLGAANIEEAAPLVLQAVCEALQWDVGVVWLPDATGQALRCAQFWHGPGLSPRTFEDATRRQLFLPGIGLPGRVWANRTALWIPDVTQDTNFPRAPAARQDGLHGAFGFPIFGAREETLGVIEFFSREVAQPDEDLLRMMDTLGGLLGQFIGRKRAETELAMRAAELARSNEELERFAYVASHDLQEPLRTLGSYTQLLLRRFGGAGDPKVAEFSGYVSSAVTRMRDLIDGLLAYSRVARAEAVFEPADLGRLLGTALANLKHAIDRSGAVITHDELPTLRVNRSQIVQLFQNLVGNALKFRGAGPPRVEVHARQAGAEWEIAVRDHGIGVDAQHAERIFVLFQRLHPQEAYPGSGLGLAICKRIVERHGGRIWVEPAQPGSVFRFTLPA